MSDPLPDVIVVGGGPAGASTAFYLARAGASVLVLDRANFPRDKPCAEYLSPECSRILDDMGALAPCEAAGAAKLVGMIIRAPNGTTVRGDFAAVQGFRGFRDRGLALRRTLLDAILLDRARAAGARVEEGARVVDVTRDAGGRVTGVRTLDGGGATRDRRARIVVAADALRAVVAHRLGVAHTTRSQRRTAFVAHYTGVGGVTDCGEMHVHLNGYAGFANVGNGVTNVAIVVPMKHARAAAGRQAEFMDAWFAGHPDLAARLAGATRIGPVRVTGPFASRARHGVLPGVALVGDAADFYDPFTGEGIFTALRGGELLAPATLQSLAATNDRAAFEALRAYDDARRRVFGGKWRVERIIGTTITVPRLMNLTAAALARHKDMVDTLIGVAGDFVPPSEVLRPSFLLRMLVGGLLPVRAPRAVVAEPPLP
ncbi:MAG: NAD(P)/FAD-dependent oxidoreductase [Gemmatimonadaceae bacterium]